MKEDSLGRGAQSSYSCNMVSKKIFSENGKGRMREEGSVRRGGGEGKGYGF